MLDYTWYRTFLSLYVLRMAGCWADSTLRLVSLKTAALRSFDKAFALALGLTRLGFVEESFELLVLFMNPKVPPRAAAKRLM